MIIVLRSFFHKSLNVYINYEYQKGFILKELTFLKELMLIKRVDQKSVMFATTRIFKAKGLSFNHMYAIGAMIY